MVSLVVPGLEDIYSITIKCTLFDQQEQSLHLGSFLVWQISSLVAGRGGGHYGLGGQIIKNAKGHKKLRQRAQNSGKTQDRPEVSKEILLS